MHISGINSQPKVILPFMMKSSNLYLWWMGPPSKEEAFHSCVANKNRLPPKYESRSKLFSRNMDHLPSQSLSLVTRNIDHFEKLLTDIVRTNTDHEESTSVEYLEKIQKHLWSSENICEHLRTSEHILNTSENLYRISVINWGHPEKKCPHRGWLSIKVTTQLKTSESI